MKTLNTISNALQLIAFLAALILLVGLPIQFLEQTWYVIVSEVLWTSIILVFGIKVIQHAIEN